MTAAKDLKKGSYVLLNNEVYQVARKETVAYGTHSHSKTKLFARPLFSKGEKSFNLSHHENVEELDIKKKTGQVISTSPVQIMDMHSYETLDAEAGDIKFSEGDEVIFIDYRGKTKIVELKRKV